MGGLWRGVKGREGSLLGVGILLLLGEWWRAWLLWFVDEFGTFLSGVSTPSFMALIYAEIRF